MRNLTGFARSNPKSRRKIARHPFRLPPPFACPFFSGTPLLAPEENGTRENAGESPFFPHAPSDSLFSPGRYNLSTRCINHQVSQVTGGIIHGNERKSGGRLLRFPRRDTVNLSRRAFLGLAEAGWDSSWGPCCRGRRSLGSMPPSVWRRWRRPGRGSAGSAPWRGPAWATSAWRG